MADALRPVLEAGLPIESSDVASSLTPLRSLLDWSPDDDSCRRQANQLLRNVLQNFASEELAPAARKIFGEYRGSSASIDERRQAASTQMHMPPEQFMRDIEPSILNTFAYQVIQVVWPRKALLSQRSRLGIIPRLSYWVVLALLALAITTNWIPRSVATSQTAEGRLRIAAATSAALLALVTLIFSIKRRAREKPEGNPYYQSSPYPDPDFLTRCQTEAAERLDQSRMAVPLLIDMILSPSEYRMRTVETISLVGRSIKQSVSLEFSLNDTRALLSSAAESHGESGQKNGHRLNDVPDEAHSMQVPQVLYIPVLVPRKGDLIDRFTITRSDGRAALSLSYAQGLRVMSLGLRYLLLSALSKPGDTEATFNTLEFRKAELILLRLVARRGPVDRKGVHWTTVQKTVDRILQSLDDQFPLASAMAVDHGVHTDHARQLEDREAALQHTRDYVLKLVQSYPIIVSLPNDPQPRRRLRFERTIVPAPRETARLRLWLGLRPDRVRIPLNLAFETDSYHLEVVGPSEHYVHEQFIGCRKCNQRLRSDWRGTGASDDTCNHAPVGLNDRCYMRVRNRAGQNYAHVYMRGFASSRLDDSEMVMKARFAEAPPGVEERALISALVASVVFAVTGYILSRHPHFPLQGSVHTDVPALFLAIPGVAATWFGFSSDADTVLRSSLTARVSLLITGLLSIAAVSCYLLEDVLGWTEGSRWGVLGVHERIWLVILITSLVNVGLIIYKSAFRMMHFVWLSSRVPTRRPEVGVEELADPRKEAVDEMVISAKSTSR